MKAKEIAILVIFLVFIAPLLLKVALYATTLGDSSIEESTQDATDLMEEAATLWWMNILVWLADLGTLGALLIIGFIVFLKWVGEI